MVRSTGVKYLKVLQGLEVRNQDCQEIGFKVGIHLPAAGRWSQLVQLLPRSILWIWSPGIFASISWKAAQMVSHSLGKKSNRNTLIQTIKRTRVIQASLKLASVISQNCRFDFMHIIYWWKWVASTWKANKTGTQLSSPFRSFKSDLL